MFTTKRRSCGDKTAFWSHSEAVSTIRYLVREKGVLPGRLNAYECEYCGWFHIGHKRVIRRGVKSSWTTA
jgi:hypothetical protein